MVMAKKKIVDYHVARAKLHDFKKYLDHLQNDADEYLKSKYTETKYTVGLYEASLLYVESPFLHELSSHNQSTVRNVVSRLKNDKEFLAKYSLVREYVKAIEIVETRLARLVGNMNSALIEPFHGIELKPTPI